MTPEQIQERENRLRKAFIDHDFGEAGASLDASPFAGAIEDRERLLMSSAVAGWAGSMMGRRVNPASPEWQGIKDGIARGYFKNREASNVSDEDLFSKIAQDYRAQDALADAARTAAARGESWLGKFREVEKTVEGIAGGRQTSYLGLARQVHDSFRAKVLPYQSTIKSVAEKARSIETSPEGMDWTSMARELIQVPKEDRPYVLEAISRQATADIDADAADRLKKEFSRGFERWMDTAATGGLGTIIGAILPTSDEPLSPEEQSIEQQSAEEYAQFQDLRDDIRDIATGKLAKLEDVRLMGMNVSGAVRNLPMTLGAFVPYAGPAAILGSFQRETANELRRTNPTMSRDDIEQIATISAPFQAVTEVVSDRLLFGRLPSFKKLFTTPVFSAGGIAAQFAGRTAIGTTTEVAEELAQGIIPRLVQSLKTDVPGVDWDGYFQDFKDQSPELIATILPLALFGAGVGQAADYRASVQMLVNADELMAAKIPEAEARKIAELATSGKREEAETLFRGEFLKAVGKGEAPAEMRAAALRVIEANKAQAKTEAINAKEAANLGVRVFRDAESWKVELANGDVIQADSAEAARRIRSDIQTAATEYEAETMAALVDDLVKLRPQTRVELRPEVAAGTVEGIEFTDPITGRVTKLDNAKSFQNLRDQAAAIDGQAPDLAQSARLILGDNYFEFGEGIARVFRHARGADITPQANTAMHEVIENSFRRGLASGLWTEQDARNAIGSLIPALEAGITRLGKKAQSEELRWLDNAKKAAAEGNSDLVREVISEMGVRAWIGRDRDGNKTGLRPGTILRALDAAILQEKKPENVTTFQRLRAWFKAVGAYLKGVVATAKIIRNAERNGTIDDFTGFLDKVLGLEAATREEAEVTDGVKEMAFSLAPELVNLNQAESEIKSMLPTDIRVDYQKFDDRAPILWRGEAEFPDVKSVKIIGADSSSKSRSIYPSAAVTLKNGGVFVKRFRVSDHAQVSQTAFRQYDLDYRLTRERGETERAFDKRILKAAEDDLISVARVAWEDQMKSLRPLVDLNYRAALEKQKAQEGERRTQELQRDDTMRFFRDDSMRPAKVYKNKFGWSFENGVLKDSSGKELGQFTNLDAARFWIRDEYLKTTFSLAPEMQSRAQPVTPAQDAEYLAAVEAGDMAKAQRMVDEAAKKAGLTLAWRAVGGDVGSQNASGGFYATSKRAVAEFFAGTTGRVERVALKLGRTQEVREDTGPDAYDSLESFRIAESEFGDSDFDSISALDIPDGPENSDVFVVRKQSQIKSANPVTYDDAGNVIPLSQRFNPETPDIRFSLSPTSGIDVVSDTLESWQSVFDAAAKRNPERAMAIREKMLRDLAKLRDSWTKDRWTVKGDKIRAIVENRTKASLDDEQAMREALRYQELLDEGMMSLTPETLMAWSEGVGTLEDDPLIAKMLHDNGKLMSKSTAERDGLPIKDLYDDAVWIPPQWYSKGAGITPDVMANNLGFDTASEMWAALDSSIKSHRAAKAGYAKAEVAVKGVEKAAREQAKAEAAAWRQEADDMQAEDWSPRESLVRDMRTLNIILSAFPPEVRAKITGGSMVKLAGLATERARYKAINTALEKAIVETERFMRKEYAKKVKGLFDRYAPEAKSGEKPKGKLGPDVQEIYDAAKLVIYGNDTTKPLNAEQTQAELTKLNSLIAADGITPEEELKLSRQRSLVEILGDWKNADSGRMAAAVEALEDTFSEGWASWKLRQLMIREEREAARKELRSGTKKKGLGKERDAMEQEAALVLGKASSSLLNISSFSDVMKYAFGAVGRAKEFITRERNASNAYEDAIQALGDRIQDFYTSLGGGSVIAGERIRYDLAHQRIKVGSGDSERNLTQMQGIQALLMWQQEDGRRHMEGPREENGQPVEGKWSYDEAWIADLESKLSDEAKATKLFLQQLYSEEWAPLNAVYREIHGINLPRHDLYAPLTVKPQQAKQGEMVDPVSGAAIAGSILTPGSLRSRNRTAQAEPNFRDALTVFLAHSRQMEHWKNYYQLAVDLSAVLGNREVMNAVEASIGQEGVTVLRKWIDAIAQGGFRDAAAQMEISQIMSRVAGRAATVALLGRVSTLLVQSTQLAAASVRMPVGAYLKRFGKLMTGNLAWGDAINSDFIQRRIKQAPPIVRQAMTSLGTASRPNAITAAVRFLGNLLSGADGLFTGGTYAILLDWHRSQGAKMGLEGAELETYAHDMAATITEEVAQPVRMANRSLMELTSTNPLAKVSWAYSSEARQKIALFFWAAKAAKSDPVNFGKTAFLTFIVGGLVSQVLKNLWREAKGDDDEKKWSVERLTTATIAGPLHGIPLASEVMGNPGQLSSIAWSKAALEDVFKLQADMQDVQTLLSVSGYVNDNLAGIAALGNLGFDFAKIIQAATKED